MEPYTLGPPRMRPPPPRDEIAELKPRVDYTADSGVNDIACWWQAEVLAIPRMIPCTGRAGNAWELTARRGMFSRLKQLQARKA